MKYREVRRCAVCGRIGAANKFCTNPKTTCLDCLEKNDTRVAKKKAVQKERIIKEKEMARKERTAKKKR